MTTATLDRSSTVPVWRVALVGLGHVGSSVVDLLLHRRAELRAHGIDVVVTGVAELGGGAVDPDGLDLAAVLESVRASRPVSGLPGSGRPGLTPLRLLDEASPDVLLEATPVNLRDGEPGLGVVLRALRRGTHVVLANKGPLALAYRALATLGSVGDEAATADAPWRPRLRFSACVGGALPVVNIGRRDLAGARILRFEGVLNGTSHSILRALERGDSYEAAVRDAQRRGIAEADPALDVDGLDAAAKLVIVANAVLRQPTTLADVAVRGIRGLGAAASRAAAARGRRLVPLARAELVGGAYRLDVGPVALDLDHPLARLDADEMGVVFTTDTVGRVTAASLEPDARPAAAAMVRDVLDVARCEAAPPLAVPPLVPITRVKEQMS